MLRYADGMPCICVLCHATQDLANASGPLLWYNAVYWVITTVGTLGIQAHLSDLCMSILPNLHWAAVACWATLQQQPRVPLLHALYGQAAVVSDACLQPPSASSSAVCFDLLAFLELRTRSTGPVTVTD